MSRKRTLEEIKEIVSKQDIIIVSTEYVNNGTPLDFICNKHKDKGIQSKSWGNMQSKKAICTYCHREPREHLWYNKKPHEKFVQQVYEVHLGKYTVLSPYEKALSKVTVQCNKCKNIFEIRADHLLAGHGCSKCNKSRGESLIEYVLKKHNVNYISQYRFNDCIGIKKKMPFDFYIPEMNMCIEYDGIQHFEPVEAFGGEEALILQKTKDAKKNDYCKQKNIKLLRIPYTQIENIEKILIEELMLKELS